MTSLDRLALTNYGHFTTVRVERGRARGLAGHLARLVRDCRTVFGVELDPDRVRAAIRDAAGDAAGPVTVRVTVFDPDLPLERPAAPAHPRIRVTTRPAADGPLPALRLRSVRYARDLPAVKHTGLFGALHERRRAQQAGYDDALFTGADAMISEGPTWNIGWCDGGDLVLPLAPALAGVTLALLAGAHAGRVRTEPVGLSRLAAMDAAFVTNAAFGVREVRCVDDTRWPDGQPLLDRLRAEYAAVEPEPV